MINQVVETVTSAIETVVHKVEKIDTDATNRPVIYGQDPTQGDLKDLNPATQIEKLRVVTGDLIDLWLY